MSKYTGVDPTISKRPRANSRSSSSEDESYQTGNQFIEIRAIDVNSEVMDLKGELNVAMVEIQRLRK